MPQLDLSVEALYEYEGRNPCPDGFDVFWDEALRELESVPPRVELVRHEIAAPFAECFHLTFDGIDGARQYAKFLRPKTIEAPVPCVLEFHGYTGNSGDWVGKLPFVARGQAIAALDCRGQGGRSEDGSRVTGNTHNGHIIRGLDDAINGRPEALYYRPRYRATGARRFANARNRRRAFGSARWLAGRCPHSGVRGLGPHQKSGVHIPLFVRL